MLIRDGKIAAVGGYADVARPGRSPMSRPIDHRPHLILPGFIDAHVHFPQMQVIASYGAELLDWLNTYTFPEETKFFNPQHGRRIARLFLDEMVRQGTTTVAAYCSVHKESAEAFFAEAAERNMLVIAGKVMMDRNAPEGVRDTPQSGYDDSKALIAAWHGKGRALYAITPRFAITSSPEQMQMAGRAAARASGLPHADASLGKPRRDRLHARALSVVARLYRRLRALRAARAKEPVRPLHPSVRARGGRAVGIGFGRGVLPDLQPVPGLRPVRLPALPHAGKAAEDRHGNRCRRRHQLFDAAGPWTRATR